MPSRSLAPIDADSLLSAYPPTGRLPQVHRAPRLSITLLLACGIAAVALTVALLANSIPHLPFGLDRYGALVLGVGVAAGLVTLIWPELALPVIVIGAGLLDLQFGGERVRHLVFVKLALFVCAGIGLACSSLSQRGRFVRVRTPADLPAFLLVCYTAASAAYGYAVAGRDLDSVAVTGYHLAQLALYHFAVTTTLCRPEAFRRSGIIVITWSLAWVLPSLLMAGRGGGTATTWLIILLCYATVSRGQWLPLVWAALPFALLDTLTSGYRTLWVGIAGQLGWLTATGLSTNFRRVGAIAMLLLVVAIVGGTLVMSRPSLLDAIPAADTLQRFETSLSAGGYRLPEALIGLAAFKESPVFGHGVGHQTPILWVDTMGYMPVGPIYHVYYISYLSNEGIIGLAIVAWYFAAVLLSRPARRMRRRASGNQWAAAGVGLQAAFFGAILGAFLAGPTDGHWTWGLFGAGALLPAVLGRGSSRTWHGPNLVYGPHRAVGEVREVPSTHQRAVW